MSEQNDEKNLHDAAREGNLELAKSLVSAGANVNERDRRKCTPLMLAADRGHVEMARFLIDQGAKVNLRTRASPVEDGRLTALVCACDRRGKTGFALAEILLEAGADPNLASSDPAPLELACMNENYELAKLLLEHGADPDGAKKSGAPMVSCVLHSSGSGRYPDIMKELLAHGATMDLGGSFLEHTNSIECARQLLESGADRHALDSTGDTALRRALMSGSVDLVKLYIEFGADANALHAVGKPVLTGAVDVRDMESADSRNLEAVELLIEAGANLNYVMKGNRTVLDYLVCRIEKTAPHKRAARQQVVDFLREKGARTWKVLKSENEAKKKMRE